MRPFPVTSWGPHRDRVEQQSLLRNLSWRQDVVVNARQAPSVDVSADSKS